MQRLQVPWRPMSAKAQDTSILLVTFSSVLVGIFFPRFGSWFSPFPFYCLMGMLLLSFLTLPLEAIGQGIKDSAGFIGGLVTCKLLVLPLGLFFAFRLLLPSHALAALLLTGISTGVVAPYIASLLPANRTAVLSTVVLTSLLAPLTLPALVKVLAGQTLQISFFAMARTLCAMIFVPFVLSEVLKRWAARLVKTLLGRRHAVSLVLFAGTNLGLYSRYPEYFRTHLAALAVAAAVALALAVVYVLAGLLLGCRGSLAEQVAGVLSFGLPNNMLMLVLSTRFFGPHEFTVAATYTIPFFGMIAPLRSYARWRQARAEAAE